MIMTYWEVLVADSVKKNAAAVTWDTNLLIFKARQNKRSKSIEKAAVGTAWQTGLEFA